MALRHRPTALAILLACALACSITPAAAFNIYKVDPDCVALGAYAHVQDAINAAASIADPRRLRRT